MMDCVEIGKKLDAEFVAFQTNHNGPYLSYSEVCYLHALTELVSAFNRYARKHGHQYQPTRKETRLEIETVSGGEWFNSRLYRLFGIH